ncbi:hypothetical protein ILUMI_03134 [Ignelater luminosus]|uniref:Chaoptin n=1 Tax=Ignelater luminosus TaxID=2038154 RepID=A0A8K0DF81_IGNLU|nr:hypothetical protein ILUMI_03134 [Ignelater luminosus]
MLRFDPKVLEGLKLRELIVGYLKKSIVEEDIYDKFNDLQVLQLVASNMSEIPAFPASVRELNLFNNRITSIKAADFKILNETNSSSNTPTRFEVLNLVYNRIATIEAYAFANLSRLRILDMDANKVLSKIDEYSFAQSTVEELHLDLNGIRSIDPGAFRGLHLSILELGSNTIRKIERNPFPGSSIQQINLIFNEVEIIEPPAFSDVKNLQMLVLSYNRMGKIGEIFSRCKL